LQIKIKTRILWISNLVLLQNLIVSNRLKQSKEVLKTSKTYGSRPNFERNITRIDLGNVLGQMLFKHSKK